MELMTSSPTPQLTTPWSCTQLVFYRASGEPTARPGVVEGNGRGRFRPHAERHVAALSVPRGVEPGKTAWLAGRRRDTRTDGAQAPCGRGVADREDRDHEQQRPPIKKTEDRMISFAQVTNGAVVMAAVSSAARRIPNREAALKSLYDDVAAKNMFPFWATSADVAHDEISLEDQAEYLTWRRAKWRAATRKVSSS